VLRIVARTQALLNSFTGQLLREYPKRQSAADATIDEKKADSAMLSAFSTNW
jgi:hypothetical protein